MLVHLARLNPRHVTLGAMGVTVLAAVTAAVVCGPHCASDEPGARREHTHSANAREPRRDTVTDLRVGALLSPGRCARSATVCVHDVNCAVEDHCVDETQTRARLAEIDRDGRNTDDEPLAAISPSLARDGEGYGVVWAGFFDDYVDLYFTRIDANGRKIGKNTRLTRTQTMKIAPQVVRGRNGWLVSWTDVGEADVNSFVLRLKDDGTPDGAPTKVSRSGGVQIVPRAVWNGHDYAVTWLDLGVMQQMSVRFQRLSTTGGRVGNETTLARGQFITGLPSLGSMGDGYGYGWTHYHARDDRSIARFVRVGASGEVTSAVNVAQGQGRAGTAAVAWSGSRFGLAWEDDVKADDDAALESALAFAAIGAREVEVPRRDVTKRDALHVQPEMTFSGEQYGLVYTRVNGDGAFVTLSRLGADGAARGTPVTINPSDSFGFFPAIAQSDQGFAIAWTQLGRDGVVNMFARYDSNGQRVGAPVIIAAH